MRAPWSAAKATCRFLRLVAAVLLGLVGSAAAAGDRDCRIGTYRLINGSDVDVGFVDGNHLRWRRKDGTTGLLTRTTGDQWVSTLGWTGRPDGMQVSFDCARQAIDFAGTEGERIGFDMIETRFLGAGVELAGRLVLPKGTTKVPIVVLVHGSEKDSAMDLNALQRLLPSAGIGAFVYDKRGTGASGGRYTQDFLLLAEDAIAAMHEARRLAGPRAGRTGYQGASQGGWVAPLAARIEAVDFVVVSFGLAVSPLEEDREAIALDMSRRGYGPQVMAKAMEVADATSEVLLSDFREGYDKVAAVKRKYGGEPWFKYVHGNVTFAILAKTPAELRELGPTLLPSTPWQYDPMQVLRTLTTPQLWILGGEDIDAPSATTTERLKRLQAAGRPVTVATFPRAEHGIYQFETAADGTRLDTRQPASYFPVMRDFILKGTIGLEHGAARISLTHKR